MLTGLCLLVGGAAIYNFIKGDSTNDEIIYGPDDTICYFNNPKDNYEQDTFEYFLDLRIDEQEHYYKENLDLRYYLDDPCKGLTNDRYMNAKHAAEVARVTGKRFTDKNKTY